MVSESIATVTAASLSTVDSEKLLGELALPQIGNFSYLPQKMDQGVSDRPEVAYLIGPGQNKSGEVTPVPFVDTEHRQMQRPQFPNIDSRKSL